MIHYPQGMFFYKEHLFHHHRNALNFEQLFPAFVLEWGIPILCLAHELAFVLLDATPHTLVLHRQAKKYQKESKRPSHLYNYNENDFLQGDCLAITYTTLLVRLTWLYNHFYTVFSKTHILCIYHQFLVSFVSTEPLFLASSLWTLHSTACIHVIQRYILNHFSYQLTKSSK